MGESTVGASDGITWPFAQTLLTSGTGIISNWWRSKGLIAPAEIQDVLTDANLDRHIHEYDVFGPNTPFISLSAGAVMRDPRGEINHVVSALDTALAFATRYGTRSGAVFYCWVPVALNPAVELAAVAEEVRELNTYRRWSAFQPEGEITAKIQVPANQIERVEWWQPLATGPTATLANPHFIRPTALTNVRRYF